MQNCYVYIMASKRDGVLYIGVTSDLVKRNYQHREGVTGGFTHKYNIHLLVYYEVHGDIVNAIKREKRLKKYKREQKIKLIESKNPEWKDLYAEILGVPPDEIAL